MREMRIRLCMEENRVFIDTSFFVAIFNGDDSLHRRALEVMREMNGRAYLPITSNFIVSETITVLSQRASKQTALIFVDFIYHRGADMQVLTVERDLEERALRYFSKMPSKNISFCDCVSLAVMEVFGIKKIATFDRDFRIKDAPYDIIN